MKKKLVILGAGESGIGTALLATQKGYDVFVSDGGKIKEEYKNELLVNGIDFEESSHTEEKILSADEVMKSPGIPEKKEIVNRFFETIAIQKTIPKFLTKTLSTILQGAVGLIVVSFYHPVFFLFQIYRRLCRIVFYILLFFRKF